MVLLFGCHTRWSENSFTPWSWQSFCPGCWRMLTCCVSQSAARWSSLSCLRQVSIRCSRLPSYCTTNVGDISIAFYRFAPMLASFPFSVFCSFSLAPFLSPPLCLLFLFSFPFLFRSKIFEIHFGGLGQHCELSVVESERKSNCVYFSLNIWHLLATFLIIFV